MEKLNRDAKRYLRQIRGWLPCAGRMKRNMLDKIRENLLTFQAENPAADYQAIAARFGMPRQIASACVDESETGELLKALRVRRRLVAIALTTAAVLIAMWAGVVTMAYLDARNDVNGYIIEEVVEFN